jgi:hypothetical protein
VKAFSTSSGRIVRVNDNAKEPAVLCSEPTKIAVAARDSAAHNPSTSPVAWKRHLRSSPTSSNDADLLSWLDEATRIANFRSGGKTGATSRSTGLALRLRREGVLVLPVGCFANQHNPFLPPGSVTVGKVQYSLFSSFEQKLLAACDRRAKSDLAWLLAACEPVFDEAGFSSEALLSTVEIMSGEFALRDSQIAHRIRWVMVNVGRTLYIDDLAIRADQLLKEVGYGRRRSFRWASYEQSNQFSDWISLFDEYIKTRRMAQESSVRGNLIVFLKWLRAKNLWVSPTHLSKGQLTVGSDSFLSWLSATYVALSPTPNRASSEVYRFFDWLGERESTFRNPLRKTDVLTGRADRSKTTKALIPNRVLKEAESICRQLLDASFQGVELSDRMEKRFGFLRVESREPGVTLSRYISPVRPTLLLLLLALPLRVIQARLSDSGEADELLPFIEDGEAGKIRVVWRPNCHVMSTRGRQQGFIRRFIDANASYNGDPDTFAGFYVNSNKTALYGKGLDAGYEIPWQKDRLIKDLIALRDWQMLHNPASRLLARDELQDKRLMPTEDLRGNLPSYIYLFRDLIDRRSGADEPVTYERINTFFHRVMAEVEDRFNECGMTDECGDPIKLITFRNDDGTPISGVYSLHGLRVAGITAFAEAGVPVAIIAEFLAGHATILMTLYYNKIGPATVTRVLEEASASFEARDHERWMRSALREPIQHGKIATNPNWLHADLEDCVPGLWSVRLDGICPNGQTRCHDGGPASKSRFVEVPGGKRNCPMCRHWLTGPTFIQGQTVSINAHLFRMRQKAERLVALHEQRRLTGSKQHIGDAIDGLEIELNEDVETLNARHRLLQQSIDIERDDPREIGALAVIARNHQGIDATYRDVEELEFLDYLSQAVTIYPEVDAADAPLRRNVLLDQLLERDGFSARLYKMPRTEAATLGNSISNLLRDLYGPDALTKAWMGEVKMPAEAIDSLSPRQGDRFLSISK